MNAKVDEYLNKIEKWKQEFEKLRVLLLDCGLTEELKWGVPCYTFQKNNIALIHGFKEYFALSFFKGALLSDTNNILITPTENSQAARQVRFASIKDIIKHEAILKTYVFEAIEIERAGLKIEYKKTAEFNIPEELQSKLNENSEFKTAFFKLTPGRQRGYLLYFSEPKQAKTRDLRIEKCMQRIINGKGLTDCTCGLSKKMPGCDGSHKLLKKM